MIMRAELKEYQAVEAAALKRLKGVVEGKSAIAKDAFSGGLWCTAVPAPNLPMAQSKTFLMI